MYTIVVVHFMAVLSYLLCVHVHYEGEGHTLSYLLRVHVHYKREGHTLSYLLRVQVHC